MAFLQNADPEWIDELYRLWKSDPGRLTPDWRAFFEGYDLAGDLPASPEDALKQSAVQSLIYRYRDNGHLAACTDPLSPCTYSHPLLDLSQFGLTTADLDRSFSTRRFMKQQATLREILEVLQQTWCRSIGVEFMHIQEPSERQWFIDRLEPVRNRTDWSERERLAILEKLMEATLFEEFLHRRFPGQKRFSLEGGESLIPFLESLAQGCAEAGCTELLLGMPHRGRLNVLANIFQKPYHNIFSEFRDNPDGIVGEGDVKYHKGFSIDRTFPGGRRMHLMIVANPSHLESVDGVVEGKARARQERAGREGQKRLLPVIIHGDAAFAGQGIVAEVFNLSQLEGYRTGGTVHIVLNNQIGFTTVPKDARSSRYSTDMAKIVGAPVFHVHGDDPEAVCHVARVALEYRQQFGRDVVVEILCFRRHGHNETDEPLFTQPAMYRIIRDRLPAWRYYAETLTAGGIDAVAIEKMAAAIGECLERSFGRDPEPVDRGFGGTWSSVGRQFTFDPVPTGLPPAILKELASVVTTLPEGFQPHPKIAGLLEKRRDAILQDAGMDWGTAETLAYASLLKEGVPVRLSGQDSRRGTFNHRHAHILDQVSSAVFVPLDQAATGSGVFSCYDSPLSEIAVLAFEYGYSLSMPDGLTIWEAQFGDFANAAQPIIDQYLASGEAKWDRVSGLTLLLPHGYEGQGAEHSSARIERFLQLCADGNMIVCTPSTPAQFFHLLRRQVKQQFRKPLVIFTPKSLLRHPRCVSRLSEFEAEGFREIIGDTGDPAATTAVLLCSGKIYYELLEKREETGRGDLAILRVEQLYPLHQEMLGSLLAPYRDIPVAWVQEEPENMGAWHYIRPFLARLADKEPHYAGRAGAAAPAVGSHHLHQIQQEKLVAQLFAPGGPKWT